MAGDAGQLILKGFFDVFGYDIISAIQYPGR
jgi:hypothetical protein